MKSKSNSESDPNNDAHGEFIDRGEVRLTRLLPGPIERVWQYLTDPEKRARWIAGGITELRAGGRIVFAMRHANLSPGETPPERYRQVQDPGVTFEGRVLRCEPPRLLVFTFGGDDSEVTFELTPQGGSVLLVLTHRAKGEDLPDLSNYASGWHTHVALLTALLEGKRPPPFWATHMRRKCGVEGLRIRLEFLKPWESQCVTEFTLVPQGSATVLTWSMSGPNKFIGKLMCVFMSMDKMIGGDYEEGLASLKSLVEAK